jgi:hypothetical protein
MITKLNYNNNSDPFKHNDIIWQYQVLKDGSAYTISMYCNDSMYKFECNATNMEEVLRVINFHLGYFLDTLHTTFDKVQNIYCPDCENILDNEDKLLSTDCIDEYDMPNKHEYVCSICLDTYKDEIQEGRDWHDTLDSLRHA